VTILLLLFSFLFCLANGRNMRGYTWFLWSQILGSAIQILLNWREAPSREKYCLTGFGAGLHLGLTCAFAAFHFALVYDFAEKCQQFKSIEDRTFNFAFAYNCDDSYLAVAEMVVFVPIMVLRVVGLLVEASKCLAFRVKETDAVTPLVSAPGATQRSCGPAVYAFLAFVIAIAASVPTFFINDYSEVEGSCPIVNLTLTGKHGGAAASLFRAKPAKGVELKECGWRRWQKLGTCVKYPFNYTNFGATSMSDVTVGQYIPPFDSNDTDPCDTMLGLFSCATHSGRAGDYINYVKGEEIHMNVCPDWCDRLFRACSKSRCKQADTAEECCKSLSSSNRAVNMVKDTSKPNNGCYSKAHQDGPSVYVLLSLLFGTLMMNVKM
jgi:hypothetical protein